MLVGQVVSVVSLLLIFGIIMGMLFDNRVNRNQHSPFTSMRPVTTFCEPALYKDVCAKSVGDVAKNATASGKDFLLATFTATMADLNATKQNTANVTVSKTLDLYHYKIVQDCKELLDFAMDAVDESISMINQTDTNALNEVVDELLNYLGGVYAFESTCLDNFQNADLRRQMEEIMGTSSQLTDNAIKIVADINKILKAFNVTVPAVQPNNQRRLLNVEDEYPSWFPAADRELLQTVGKRRIAHAVVSKDGTGRFITIADAINAYPKGFRGRYIVYVKAGIYEEKVIIDKTKPFVFIYGDGAGKTIITGNDNFGVNQTPTWKTATFSSMAKGVVIKRMTIRNTAGPTGHQAVALRVQGDMTAVFDCSIEGFQDTLYYHTFRQFYRNCAISGTVDFIFGQGAAVIQSCSIIVRKNSPGQSNTITADGNAKINLNQGLVIHMSKIVPELALVPDRFSVKTYLGRPWKAFATTILLKCELGDFIRPEGWLAWQGESFQTTCRYGEFENVGPGAATNLRDKAFKKFRVLSPREANRYSLASFIGDAWLKRSYVPYLSTL